MVCAATSPRAAVFTNQLMRDKPGSSLVFTMPDRLAQCGFIRQMQTSCGSRLAAISLSQIQSGEYSRPPMADRPGTKCCLYPTLLARWMLKYSRAIPPSFMHGCRNSNENPGPSLADQERADSTKALTAANISRALLPACPLN